MNKKNTSDKFAIIGAVCLIVYSVCEIIPELMILVQSEWGVFFAVVRILCCVSCLALATGLFLRKKNVVLVIISGVNFILELIYFVYSIVQVYNNYFPSNGGSFSEFGYCLLMYMSRFSAITLLFLFILFKCIPTLKTKITIIKYYWYFPALLLFVYYLIPYFYLFPYLIRFDRTSVAIKGVVTLTRYDEAVAFWQGKKIETDAELAEALNGHSIAFAYHSGKIENEHITYNDTREIFEHDGVSSYTGDLRTLFEIRNSKEANELCSSVKK